MSTARRVLIVDDDEDLRYSLKDQLILHDEFDVATASTASNGMELAKSNHFDLVVFDVSLPDMDGREAVRLLRKSGFKTPIVMLTGNVSDADQILGLDAGANDYITKPFKPASKLLIDEKGAKIRLTEKETSILKYLYRSGDKVVSRELLLHEVWGYNAGVTTHTLETHIYRLRQKIEKDPSNAELLVTETGGYKLVP
jgi:DNA-binding response OmpR family regulator